MRATSGAQCGSHPDKTFRENYFIRAQKKIALGFSEGIVGPGVRRDGKWGGGQEHYGSLHLRVKLFDEMSLYLQTQKNHFQLKLHLQ
ncbi:MAG TPA: hypothetical protein VLJ61_04960 [Pyrinomonadaceae bacterium]|nr:hypothetical protein [Pyrinomonadaceae bacterium]